MHSLGPASELDAVNEMLAAIGEDPVDSLDNLPPSGNTALTVLRGTSRDFQEEGHWFNSEESYELSPEPNGDILVPQNVLSLDGIGPGSEAEIVQRGDHLYDRAAQTRTFTGPVEVSLILHLPWTDLPSVARRYIVAMSVEQFVEGFPGAQGVTEARTRSHLRAKIAFEKAAIRNEGLNFLDNLSIAELLRRS